MEEGKKASEALIVQNILSTFEQLSSKKKDLFDLLNNMDEFSRILSMMKEGQIISQGDYKKIQDMLKLPGISSKFSHRESKKDEESFQKDTTFAQFINKYPLVASGEEILAPSLYEELAEDDIYITKDGDKIGLVKKIDDGKGGRKIKSLFAPLYYTTLYHECYKKYKLIGLRDESLKNPSVKFFQIQKDGEVKDIYPLLDCNGFIGFDKDGIGIGCLRGGSYVILFLRQGKNSSLSISQIGEQFIREEPRTPQFDKYNSLEVKLKKIGNVTLRKYYDETGNFKGIHAFRKSLFGKEKQVEEFCRNVSDYRPLFG